MEGARLRLCKDFDVGRGAVFDAWTHPNLMREWLFASDVGAIVHVAVDLRVGGAFSILEMNQGEIIDHFGTYLAIDRPAGLAFTLDVPKHFSESTIVELVLEQHGRGTTLSFEQTGIDPNLTRPFREVMLDTLATSLRA